jgi:cytidylate kinase
MAVITISREYGINSTEIASEAAQRLGYEYIDKHLVSQIAEKLHISEHEAEAFIKASSGRLLRFVDRYTCTLVQKVVDRSHGCLDDDKYFMTTKKLVEDIYKEGNAIILGWGGQCILKGKPGTLHVRLVKQEEAKIKTVMEEQSVDEKNAKKIIEQEETEMREYIKQFFHKDWNDARLYDLVIDLGKTSVEEAISLIIDNIKHIK